jgi:hypothetical protein
MSRPNDFYQFIPGWFPLNWPDLLEKYPDDSNHNWLAVLNSRQLSILLSVTNMVLPWYWLWGVGKQDETARAGILEFKSQLERDLMAVLSIDDLIKTNLMLWAATTGTTIDRDHPENYLTGEYAPASSVISELDNIDDAVGLLQINIREQLELSVAQLELSVAQLVTVNTRLDEIRLALEAQVGGDPASLEDELEGISTTISTVATILGVLA